jgi:hypothetical protein
MRRGGTTFRSNTTALRQRQMAQNVAAAPARTSDFLSLSSHQSQVPNILDIL